MRFRRDLAAKPKDRGEGGEFAHVDGSPGEEARAA
jgi:hypothetical protein